MSSKTSGQSGLMVNAFSGQFWNSRITSANVTKKELWLGYVAGPFGAMLLQSIVNSYFKGYDYITEKYCANEGDSIVPLLEKSDFVVLCLALTDETFHLINKETIAQMKDGAFLVNMARGGIVCTEDLVNALNSGKLSGAGLDVFEEQPLRAESPLWQMKNVYITPHTTPQVPDRAGASIEIIRENARRFEAGEPLRNLMTKADAMNGEKAEGGFARMMNAKLTQEQAKALHLEKYLGDRGWTDPSEWM